MIEIKQVSKWYGDFLAEQIFRPLQMTRTAVPRDHDIIPGRASGYFIENSQMRSESFLAWSVRSYAGGGIYSSAPDLVRWDAALDAGRLLRRETLTQMWTETKLNGGGLAKFGLGWEIKEVLGRRCAWHSGNWIGFSCARWLRIVVAATPAWPIALLIWSRPFTTSPAANRPGTDVS